MGFTDQSDLYLAIHETGINLLLKHILRQRPSLSNFGTAAIAADRGLLPEPLDLDLAVITNGDPLVTIVNLPATIDLHALAPKPDIGLTLPGLSQAPVPAFDYSAELTNAAIDFYPVTANLPPDLSPVPQQTMAVHTRVAAGLRKAPKPGEGNPPLSCFSLDLFVTTGAKMTTDGNGNVRVKPVPGGIALSGIGPKGLIDSLNLLINRLLKEPGNIPGAGYLLPVKGALSIPSDGTNAWRVRIIPTLSQGNLVNNPAVEEDQLKFWINVNTLLQKGDIPIGDAGNIQIDPNVNKNVLTGDVAEKALAMVLAGETLPLDPDQIRAASPVTVASAPPTYDWTGSIPDAPPGPDHVTAAIAGKLVDRQLEVVKRHFKFASKKHLEVAQRGATFLFDYDVLLHMESGKITRTDAGSIGLFDADIAWDRMNFVLGLCIPQQCVDVPGFGRYCVFGGTPQNPDIRIPIDLGKYLTSEIEIAGTPSIRYGRNTLRPPNLTDRAAVAAGLANEWGVFVHPDKVHVDPIDVDDTLNKVIDQAVADAIAKITAGAPAWAAALLVKLLGDASHILQTLLGLPDRLNEWVGQKIGIDLNLIADLETALAQHFVTFPLLVFPDPMTIMPEKKSGSQPPAPLISVLLPLRDLHVHINAQEMTLQGKVGPVQP